MTKRATGLEGHFELARLIFRWPALRNKPGDEIAYQFAEAVQKLHHDVRSNVIDLDTGLNDIAPLLRKITESKGGGGLFDEARKLARGLEALKTSCTNFGDSSSPVTR